MILFISNLLLFLLLEFVCNYSLMKSVIKKVKQI